jgi:transposase
MSNRTLSKKLASVKPGTVFVGIDLALDQNVAVVLTERAEQLTRFRFPNERDGYDYFYGRVETVLEQRQAPRVLVDLEPTNYFWKLLAADIKDQRSEYGYRLVNPYTVKKNREGDQLDWSKDDNRDAFTIGELLRTDKYTETRLLHGEYAELRQYVTVYTRLRRDVRRQKTLIRNVAGQLFPELPRVFKGLTGKTALAMLGHHTPVY